MSVKAHFYTCLYDYYTFYTNKNLDLLQGSVYFVSKIMNDFSQKTKVLRIISRMNVGGPSKHVVNLTDGLRKFGFDTHLLSGQPSTKEGNMYELAKEKNIDLKIIECMGRAISPLDDLKAFIRIIKEIKAFKPDIVHTHTAKAGVLGRLAAMLCGVPKIYHTYHGHVFKGYFSRISTTLIIAIERFFARFTTNLIALTPGLCSELNQILGIKDSNKIKVIPLGLDLSKNLSTSRRAGNWRNSAGFKENDIVIGIVARLVPIKNHELLINSMQYLCKTFKNLHLAIVGSGELENQLQKQVTELNLQNSVHFFGNIKAIENVYSNLDLLVLCSKNEGTPVVIIEALASGCPVAATNVGGVAEVLQNGRLGHLLHSEPKTFTKELTKIISNLSHNSTPEATRKETADRYSVENLVKNIAQLYRK